MAALKEKGVSERLFSAGIVGAGRSAHRVIEKLSASNDKLLRPKATALINDLLKQLDKAAKTLADAIQREKRYPELQSAKEELQCRRAGLEARLIGLRQEERKLQLLLSLWAPYCELKQAETSLSLLAGIPEFPESAEALLMKTVVDLENAGKDEEELKLREQALTARLEAEKRKVSLAVKALGVRIEAYCAQIELHRDRLLKLPGLKQRQDAIRRELNERIARLNNDWNARDLASFDSSMPRSEELNCWQRQLAQTAEEKKDAARTLIMRREKAAALKEEEEKLRFAWQSVPPVSKDELIRRQSALRFLRGALPRKETLEAQLEVQKLRAGTERKSGWSQTFARAACFLLLALGACSAAYALFGAKHDSRVFALLACVFGLGACIAALLRRGLGRDQTAELELARLEQELRRFEAESEQEMFVLSIEPPLRAFALEESDLRLQSEQARCERAEQLKLAMDRAASEWRTAEAAAQEAEAVLFSAERHDAETAGNWRKFLASWGVSPLLSPEAARSFYNEAAQTKRLHEEVQRNAAELEQLEDAARVWEQQVQELIAESGEAATDESGEALVQMLVALKNRLGEVRKSEEVSAELVLALDEAAAKAAAGAARRAAAEEKLGQLLASAGACDEHDYRLKLKQDEERRRLQATIRDRMLQIDQGAGGVGAFTEILALLASGSTDEWQTKLDETTDQLHSADRERVEAIQTETAIAGELEQLERAGDIPQIENDVEQLQAELSSVVLQWKTNRAAEELVRQTLRRYASERQPAALEAASRVFARITRRYMSIIQEDEGEKLVVIDAQQGRKALDALSRGTAEQLYLCLRLGLVEEFSRRTEPLPMIMDDVLVNFDRERAKDTLLAIEEFSRINQTLLFTCHPWIEELVREVIPEACVVRLPASERTGGLPIVPQPS